MDKINRYELRVVQRYSADGEGDIETDASMKLEPRGRYVLFEDVVLLLAAQQGASVILPERMVVPGPLWKDARQPYGNPLNHAEIEAAKSFNLALDEVVRLNATAAPKPAAADVKGLVEALELARETVATVAQYWPTECNTLSARERAKRRLARIDTTLAAYKAQGGEHGPGH